MNYYNDYMEIMDNTYLSILGVLVLLLVTFAYVYYLRTSKSLDNEPRQNQEHNQSDVNVECDGDKCFIKHVQT
jgi:hypothetical protein